MTTASRAADKFLPKEFAQCAGDQGAGGLPTPEFVPPCPPEVVEIYNKIWTNLRK